MGSDLGPMLTWIFAVLATLGTLALVLVAVLPIVRSKRTSATIELLNSELEIRDAALQAHELRQAEQERHHAEVVAELRGEIKALRVDYARAVAADVGEELARILTDRVVDGVGTKIVELVRTELGRPA